MKNIVKLHYAIYSCEEWSIMMTLCDRIGAKYRTRKGNFSGYVEVIIAATDEAFHNMEYITAQETIEFV